MVYGLKDVQYIKLRTILIIMPHKQLLCVDMLYSIIAHKNQRNYDVPQMRVNKRKIDEAGSLSVVIDLHAAYRKRRRSRSV